MTDSPHPPATPPSVVDALRASQLKDAVQHYAEALRARRKGLDKLNVYPVPDGDTGTNMSLTVQSVVNELRGAATDDMHAIAQAISRGAVMGARGNSGAILAQVLRGVAESVKDKSVIGPQDVADALERARHSAYESVLKPVEGTILTVVTAAADAAKNSAAEGHKLREQMDHIRQASADALARTPELLPVLKRAGVVDAGGSGFMLFVDSLRYVVTGEPIPGVTDADLEASGEELGDGHAVGIAAMEHTELSDLRYEIMFLLDADDGGIPRFREVWGSVGDSIVVVGGDGLWNCHIHSDDIGAAIEVVLDFGRPRQIRVTDLQLQAGAEHGAAWSDAEPLVEQERVSTAVVAVVNGDGVSRIYRSMGAQQLVVGGQSMNPSVAELLAAVEAAPADAVVLMPNNKNVQAAATQVNALTNKRVLVLPTVSVVQGIAALFVYVSQSSADDNLAEMQAVIERVAHGEVTQAVRNALGPTGPIAEGDWLGLDADGIQVVAASSGDALTQLVETMAGDDHEVLTVLEGEGATPAATEQLRTWLVAHRPHVELEVREGGQPLYAYLLGIE